MRHARGPLCSRVSRNDNPATDVAGRTHKLYVCDGALHAIKILGYALFDRHFASEGYYLSLIFALFQYFLHKRSGSSFLVGQCLFLRDAAINQYRHRQWLISECAKSNYLPRRVVYEQAQVFGVQCADEMQLVVDNCET